MTGEPENLGTGETRAPRCRERGVRVMSRDTIMTYKSSPGLEAASAPPQRAVGWARGAEGTEGQGKGRRGDQPMYTPLARPRCPPHLCRRATSTPLARTHTSLTRSQNSGACPLHGQGPCTTTTHTEPRTPISNGFPPVSTVHVRLHCPQTGLITTGLAL